MDCLESTDLPSIASIQYYKLLLKVATMIPIAHFIIGFACIFATTLYYLLEVHLFEDLFHGGSAVTLTYNPASHVYRNVVSKCSILHRRYYATPWLASPHLQTMLLDFVAKPPKFSYKRQIFLSSDGGTFALDWLMSSNVIPSENENDTIWEKDTTPIVVVIPGLTSDSNAAYIRHLVHSTAMRGWNVVVCNHRGMAGVPFTSDRTYNSGWTTDVRDVINHLHHKYSEAPLFAVGTSIGANILVKYLGEYGETVPLAGAAAICSPWDLLIGSRFIARKLVQNLYGLLLNMGLKSYAKSNETHFMRLADWEGIMKSRHMTEFDKAVTCTMENFETADTFYRWCSSAAYTRDVSVPLLSISCLDDPVCTPEAIPWHECRENKNIVLATTKHGGHLGFFEGITAPSLWWVRAVNEFLSVLHSTSVNKHNKVIVMSSTMSIRLLVR
ncbi:Embryogenesis-associated protein EMB8 [Heracleum sosnowskyi]|uniref:Embryogenesis-associated protein EMB8 n=1 Tax=Heracleum sosnowskyi TaxID=360622 RepID=A0AAD8MRH4_9APIA|nr:Embryogenesis-associated protein EMB8 [Heracleum sosnowskyi]